VKPMSTVHSVGDRQDCLIIPVADGTLTLDLRPCIVPHQYAVLPRRGRFLESAKSASLQLILSSFLSATDVFLPLLQVDGTARRSSTTENYEI
jgi:hypothetical protein